MNDTITFLESFKTLSEVKKYQTKLKEPTIVIHLWADESTELFAALSIQEAFLISKAINAKIKDTVLQSALQENS
jgi:hypothetical protein